MKRNERILTLVAAATVGAFVALFVVGVENTLADYPWFSNGSNVIQWVSGPATLFAIGSVVYYRIVRSCAVPWCPRIGEHPVRGTLSKVCSRHHRREHHELVHDLYAEAHRLSGHLDWGESHGRATQR